MPNDSASENAVNATHIRPEHQVELMRIRAEEINLLEKHRRIMAEIAGAEERIARFKAEQLLMKPALQAVLLEREAIQRVVEQSYSISFERGDGIDPVTGIIDRKG
jgi:hypothetical protein